MTSGIKVNNGFCFPGGSLSFPCVIKKNPTWPVVAKSDMAVVLSLQNPSGLTVKKGYLC